MTTAKQAHTSGDWLYNEATGDVWAGDVLIHRSEEIEDDEGDEQAAANSRLIAAAPDLLEACKVMYDQVSDAELRQMLRAAIARATKGDA